MDSVCTSLGSHTVHAYIKLFSGTECSSLKIRQARPRSQSTFTNSMLKLTACSLWTSISHLWNGRVPTQGRTVQTKWDPSCSALGAIPGVRWAHRTVVVAIFFTFLALRFVSLTSLHVTTGLALLKPALCRSIRALHRLSTKRRLTGPCTLGVGTSETLAQVQLLHR